MQIKINGKKQNIGKIKNLLDFIETKKLNPNHIVIEHNGKIIEKSKFSKAILNENDTIEIVSFVGGG